MGPMISSYRSHTPSGPTRPPHPRRFASPAQHSQKNYLQHDHRVQAKRKIEFEQTDSITSVNKQLTHHKKLVSASTLQKKYVFVQPHACTRSIRRGGSCSMQMRMTHHALQIDASQTITPYLLLPSALSTTAPCTQFPSLVQLRARVVSPPPAPPFSTSEGMETEQGSTGDVRAVWGCEGQYGVTGAVRGSTEEMGAVRGSATEK